MKFTDCFFPAIAAAAALVSCTQPGTEPLGNSDDAKKSVTVTIANMASDPATRGVTADGFTADETPVAQASALSVLFATADGTVVDVKSFSEAATDEEVVDNDGDFVKEYVFHQVDARAKVLAVTNIAGAAGDDLDELVAAVASVANQQSDLEDVLVWGKSALFEETETTHVDAGVIYALWDAGDVTVTPALGRLEIGNIECLDLGGDNTYENGLKPRFATIRLANIGIDNTPTGDIDGEPALYDTAEKWIAAVADAASWNIDPVAGTPVFPYIVPGEGEEEDTVVTNYAGENFVYNIAPGTVPAIMLEVNGGTWNENAGPAGVLDFPYFVKSTGLSGVESIAAGHIYQVNFKFQCKDIKKLGEDDTLVCVDVRVTIPDWVIENDLTPTFN